MGEHDVIVRGQHFEHRLSHRFDRLRLMLNRLAGVVFDNAVAADGNDHKLFHFVSFRRCVLTLALSHWERGINRDIENMLHHKHPAHHQVGRDEHQGTALGKAHHRGVDHAKQRQQRTSCGGDGPA